MSDTITLIAVLRTTFACSGNCQHGPALHWKEGLPSLLHVILLAAVRRGVPDNVRLFGNDAVWARLKCRHNFP